MPLFEPSAASIGQRAKRYGEPIYTYYRDSERPGIVAIRAKSGPGRCLTVPTALVSLNRRDLK